MAEITVTARDGSIHRIALTPGISLMEAIRKDKPYNEVRRGASCSCATCHVFVDPAFLDRLGPISEDEDDLLDSSDARNRTSRLSCQIELADSLDGLAATIAPDD